MSKIVTIEASPYEVMDIIRLDPQYPMILTSTNHVIVGDRLVIRLAEYNLDDEKVEIDSMKETYEEETQTDFESSPYAKLQQPGDTIEFTIKRVTNYANVAAYIQNRFPFNRGENFLPLILHRQKKEASSEEWFNTSPILYLDLELVKSS